MEVTFDSTVGGDSTTSYITVDYFKQFAFDSGYEEIGDVPDSDIKRHVNKASFWLDNNYRQYYTGIRQYDDQTMEWPRSSAYYPVEDFSISEDIIPSEIQKATAEVAYLLVSGEDISPTISKTGKVLEYEVKVDVLEERTVYEEGSTFYRDIYTIVNETLSRLVGGGASRFNLKMVRVGGESP